MQVSIIKILLGIKIYLLKAFEIRGVTQRAAYSEYGVVRAVQ